MTSQMTSQLTGLWLPLITPFKEGVLDQGSLERLLQHFCQLPIDGLILAGTTGESMTLSKDEKTILIEITTRNLRQIGCDLPVYFGLSGSDTSALVDDMVRYNQMPVDGYLISSPHYTRPSQAGMVEHFRTLAAATDKPIILCNIPYRTGVNLQNDAVLELAQISNIVGIKDCCADPLQTLDLLHGKPDNFSVLTGQDLTYFDALANGADGAILAAAHLETEAFAEVAKALQGGNLETARALWKRLSAMTRLLFAEPSPAAIKYVLWRQRLIESPEVRLAMTPVSDLLAARLDHRILKK